MSEIANYISQKDSIEVHMILYGISREIFYPISSRIIVHRPLFVFRQSFKFFCTLRTLFYLRKTVVKISPLSILSFGELWNSFVLLALLGLNYPVYISDRCQPVRIYSRFHTILRRTLYPKATGIIAQTEIAKTIIYNLLRHKNIKVIGNPVRDIQPVNLVRKENIVLTVGRLIDTKHHDKLIEMFLKISKPGWKLIIVGYDHLKQNNSEKLRTIITNNNAQDSVLLEGRQADVDTYYLRSRVFAFTSSSEGFPNVIGEAMAARLPVVAFDCVAGPSELIEDGKTGYLVPLFDYEQFLNKLQVLMNDPGLRKEFGLNAKTSIKRYSVHKIGEEFLNFITNSK